MKCKGLNASQRVCKKYRLAARRKLQRQEYRRLKAVLPALAAHTQVDEVEVVEEAINYIDQLHAQIISRMMQGKDTEYYVFFCSYV